MIRHLSVCIALTALWLGGASHASAIDIKDGVYQISSGADLAEFSRLVAEGNGNIKGVMTRDVDMTGIGFSPIGSGDVPFSGVFDGGCNYVRNLTIDSPAKSYVGLFGVVSNGAYIKNVIVDASSSVAGKDFCAGIAGGSVGGGTVTIAIWEAVTSISPTVIMPDRLTEDVRAQPFRAG